MKPASNKQLKFATTIARTLQITVPNDSTAYAYWKFINDHIIEFRDALSEDPSLDDCYDYFPSEWAYDGCGCQF